MKAALVAGDETVHDFRPRPTPATPAGIVEAIGERAGCIGAALPALGSVRGDA